jgi:hypothetical protein
MVLLRGLKGATRPDRGKDTSVHVSTCTNYDLNALTSVVWKLWRWEDVCASASRRFGVCSDIYSQITNNFLSEISTGNETWCFWYDTKSKWQSLQWKQPTSPRLKKPSMSKSQMKTMLTTLFDFKRIVPFEFIPQDQKVNQPYIWKYWSSYVKLCV